MRVLTSLSRTVDTKVNLIYVFFKVFLSRSCFFNRDLISELLNDAGTHPVSKEKLIEQVHEISNNVVCATSKASDQPAHTRSLIRAFASRLSIL